MLRVWIKMKILQLEKIFMNSSEFYFERQVGRYGDLRRWESPLVGIPSPALRADISNSCGAGNVLSPEANAGPIN